MSYLPNFVTLVGVWMAFVITPGPDFAVTVQYATAHSRRDGILVALGITTAIAIWITTSVVGLGVLLARVGWLIEIIHLMGGLYLVYIGIKTIMHASHPTQPMASVAPVPTRSFSAWGVGFSTNISNPKAIAFFSSLFVALLPVHPPLWVQTTSVVLLVIIAASWFCLVACLFSLAPVTRAYLRAKRWIDYLTGGIFVTLGIWLAFK
ncbi:threonine efflux protein [Ktedonobacteria bacterium brp13]|nr:threonine efflux protein [Ktedonobacteria bacterium brp13]